MSLVSFLSIIIYHHGLIINRLGTA